MARRTATVDGNGRDAGKVFLLTEAPAIKAVRWAVRALIALGGSDAELPSDIAAAGLAGVAAYGIKALSGMAYAEVDALLTDMLGCVEIADEAVGRRALTEADVEDVETLRLPGGAVLALHFDFASTAGKETALQAVGALIGKRAAPATGQPARVN